MEFKENTKKKRYSFKKGSKLCKESAGNKYLYTGSTFRDDNIQQDITYIKGKINNEWNYQFQYYAETIEQYEKMNPLLEKEKETLFSQEMKWFIEHPLLINNNKNKKELEEIIWRKGKRWYEKDTFLATPEYHSIKEEFVDCLINLDNKKYPTITWIVNNLKNRFMWNEYNHCSSIRSLINVMIDMIVRTNHSLKNFIKIMHPKEADFIIRNNYKGKSEPADYDKNRKWRKRIETNRRRKERKDNKKLINEVY